MNFFLIFEIFHGCGTRHFRDSGADFSCIFFVAFFGWNKNHCPAVNPQFTQISFVFLALKCHIIPPSCLKGGFHLHKHGCPACFRIHRSFGDRGCRLVYPSSGNLSMLTDK